jgi:hypothetical protein
MVSNNYEPHQRGPSVRNNQVNAILERINQTIGDIIRTFDFYNNDGLDNEDPWSGFLGEAMFALRAMYHTSIEALPSQLVI